MLTPRSTLDTPRARCARCVAVAHPGAARRMRQRPHALSFTSSATASAARRRSTRRRTDRDDAGAVPPRGDLGASPFPAAATRRRPARARRSTPRWRSVDAAARRRSEPATFLLDEFLELRTFESFPGLRRVLHDLVDGAGGQPQPLRAHQPLHGPRAPAAARPLRTLRSHSYAAAHRRGHARLPRPRRRQPVGRAARDEDPSSRPARCRRSPTDGRPTSAPSPTNSPRCASTAARARATPSARSSALIAADGRISRQCSFCYELRLHRARGYGALKAILEILAEEEGLTLTEISQRLQRTPGSTKDYLSWLEDVDLVTRARSATASPTRCLRLWVRLHCRATAPVEDDLAREIHRYALPRLPQVRTSPRHGDGRRARRGRPKDSGIIEID